MRKRTYIEEVSERFAQEERRQKQRSMKLQTILATVIVFAIVGSFSGQTMISKVENAVVRKQVSSLMKRGNFLAESGDLDGARKAFEEALVIEERRAKAELGNVQTPLDWAKTLERLGSISREMGDLASAEIHYLELIQIMEGFAERSPDDARTLRNRWLSYAKLAVVREESESPDALATWRQVYEQMITLKEMEALLPQDEARIPLIRAKAGLAEE